MKTRLKNFVTAIETAPPGHATAHFSSKLSHETDCWDVYSTQNFKERGFVILDVRSENAFKTGFVPGAINIPHARLTPERLANFPDDTLFVVYCAGPHCNGSTRAALRLARLGRPVKEMIGGVTGWIDEGFSLVRT